MSLAAHWPTLDERDFFQREGYLIVKNALSPELVEELTNAIDGCGHGEKGGFYNRLDILGMHPAFCELLDLPPVFAKICGFLGWNIWVNHTHYNVRPPDSPDQQYPYMWHCDGGNVLFDLQGSMPMTAIKVGFYLTDLSQSDRGQTYIIPRSSNQDVIKALGSHTPPPESAEPMVLEAGSAVMFQQRAWHSQGSPNFSEITRKTIFMQWAYRWLLPVDTMNLGDAEQRVNDPIKRQLLGFNMPRPEGKLSSPYYPIDADIPLKKKMFKELKAGQLAEIGPSTARMIAGRLKFDF